ncbi:alpha/beta hydrolase [Actinocorallia libanotica]|uniref:S-formylglutathione hydrolase FrmB n=1 Tax=Actinocorallia libanotica TaxID=46162 RepID=A0ABN1Q406_9ACTN
MKKWFTTAAAFMVAALALPWSAPAHAAPPALTDAAGLTVTGAPAGTDTNFTFKVTTPNVAGERTMRIILPADYDANPAKRYPVNYFLHGAHPTASGGEPGWAFPAFLDASARSAMITVIVDGGNRGWYTDWRVQNSAAGAAKWETFHIGQVIPFIDANLRTLATRDKRAITGYSMGGFGAMHYAFKHPDLFAHAASMSGPVDIADTLGRLAVMNGLRNLGDWCSAVVGCDGSYGPTLPDNVIFGPLIPFPDPGIWHQENPTFHADQLTDVNLGLYHGNADIIEQGATVLNTNFKAALDAEGITYRYVNYGNGSAWGTGCTGVHANGNCVEASLRDWLPRVEAGFTS